MNGTIRLQRSVLCTSRCLAAWRQYMTPSSQLCPLPSAHLLPADNAAKLFGFVEDTPWADSIKLVVVTADGLALPRFNYQLLQPMTPLRVETWADFSARLVGGSARGLV